MTERVNLTTKQAAKFVMQRWNDVGQEHIMQLARDVWRASAQTDSDSDDFEAELLVALAISTELLAVQTAADLTRTWSAIQDGHERGLDFGGLIYAEGESSNYKSVRKFIESLVIPQIIRFINPEFERLAASANVHPAGENRMNAFMDAVSELESFVDSFELSEQSIKKVKPVLDAKLTLFEQLIQAEEETAYPTKKKPVKGRRKR